MSTASATLPGRRRPILLLLRAVKPRFSLRELLLFMLACAAFFGWAHVVYRKSQPFRATHAAEYFVDRFPKDVAAIRESLGEEGHAWSIASPVDKRPLLSGVHGKDQIRLDWDCDLLLPWQKAYRLRMELTRRIIGRIKDGEVQQRVYGMAGDYYEDEIEYRCGNVCGELRICLVGIDGKPIRLKASVREWYAP